jgi:transketolase
MRKALSTTLAELGQKDDRILLLTGDLGFMALEPFSDRFPDRFINVGVAEQNMVGLGTGLAESGFIPFLYSIATFASMRAYEFIRNGPIMHELPVRIVGVGGGFEYGTAGPTHYGVEDLGLMRLQPGITVIAPADHQQARNAVLQTWDLPGPIYYRLGKDDKTVVDGLDGRFELGRAVTLGTGRDILFVTMGAISSEVAAAAQTLAQRGIGCSVMVVSSFNPDPTHDLLEALGRFPVAVTVEAHYVNGALGSLVAEVVADHGLRCKTVRCGVRTTPSGVTGSQSYLQNRHGISRGALVETALQLLVQA